MAARRVAGIGIALVALLALAALASRASRPLGIGGGDAHVGAGFFDYAFTTFLVGLVAAVVITAVAAYSSRSDLGHQTGAPWRTLAVMTFVTLVLLLLARSRALPHSFLHEYATRVQSGGRPLHLARDHTHGGRSVEVKWTEAAVVGGIAAAVVVAAVAGRLVRRRRPTADDGLALDAAAEVSAALSDAVDDLRAERDVRRAVIAAYARMEGALAAHGLPRRHSEAPREYLERALLGLHASGDAVRRLTDLFQWAKFSHHDVDTTMRDDAVEALVSVRDELRAQA